MKRKASMQIGAGMSIPKCLIVPSVVTKAKPQKPDKPTKDFPLSAHANGSWCKFFSAAHKAGISQPIMFGKWDDPKAALAKYELEKADWMAGRNPRTNPAIPKNAITTTLGQLAKEWLEMREADIHQTAPRKTISYTSFKGSASAVVQLFRHLSKQTDPSRISPQMFADLRVKLAEGVTPNTLNNRLVHLRAMFNWGQDTGRIANPVTWVSKDGTDEFKLVPKHAKAESRYFFQRKHGGRIFKLDVARALLTYSLNSVLALPNRFACMRENGGGGGNKERQMIVGALNFRAATWLAANSGTQSEDISQLAAEDVDFEVGWIDTLRAKTKVPWQVSLWPETLQYMKEATSVRVALWPDALENWRIKKSKYMSDPKNREDVMRQVPLFVTADGFPLTHTTISENPDHGKDGHGKYKYVESNSIAQATNKFLHDIWKKEKGLAFGAWRPTFQTCANETGMREKIDRIFGHTMTGSKDPYLRFEFSQLSPVTDYVRNYFLDDGLKELIASDCGLAQLLRAAGFASAKDVADGMYRAVPGSKKGI